MKKVITLFSIIATPGLVAAQTNNTPVIDKEIFNVCATIFVIGLIMFFIIVILKRNMEYRLKNKIIEKGVPENIVSSILKPSPKEDRNINIKWFAVLTGLGIGLTIIHYTLPLGFHSLAIMTLCLALSFLGYFLFLKQSEK